MTIYIFIAAMTVLIGLIAKFRDNEHDVVVSLVAFVIGILILSVTQCESRRDELKSEWRLECVRQGKKPFTTFTNPEGHPPHYYDTCE